MYTPYLLPISVKGIVFEQDIVWLRLNERNEWELPGGRLEQGENPEETVVRELHEELGFEVSVEKIVHAGVLFANKDPVFIIVYLCTIMNKTGNFELMGEAGPAQFPAFSPIEKVNLNIPHLYKEALQRA